MHDEIILESAFSSLEKSAMLEAIAEADSRLLDGGDEFLQLMSVCSTAIRALN